jgi:hypothetical protein
VAVLRPELDAPGVFRPGPAALRAHVGQVLVPPDPAAAIGQLNHVIDANPSPVLSTWPGRSRPPKTESQAPCMGYRVTPLRLVYLRKRCLSGVVTLHVTLDGTLAVVERRSAGQLGALEHGHGRMIGGPRSWSGGPGESHPRAPTERSVSLSVHSALLIAFRLSRVPRPSGRTAWALDRGARTTMP